MRNNPSNPSTLDPYDKLSAVEKAPVESGPQHESVVERDSKLLPVPPDIALSSPLKDIGKDERSVYRLSGQSSCLLPSLSFETGPSSTKLPLSALPEAYRSPPLHPSPPASPQSA